MILYCLNLLTTIKEQSYQSDKFMRQAKKQGVWSIFVKNVETCQQIAKNFLIINYWVVIHEMSKSEIISEDSCNNLLLGSFDKIMSSPNHCRHKNRKRYWPREESQQCLQKKMHTCAHLNIFMWLKSRAVVSFILCN